MGWGLAIGAAISSAGSAYMSSQSQKDAADQQAALASGADSTVFGSIPEQTDWQPVEYNALYDSPGYTFLQAQTVQGNEQNLPWIQGLTDATNAGITASNQRRIESWLPGFTANLQLGNNQAQSLLAGNVPADVSRAIAAQTAGNEAAFGTAGTSGADMNRNLGLTSLNNIQQGMSLLGNLTSITGQIDPLSMQMLPQSMFLSPSQTIPWAINENQFGTTTQMQNNENQYSADVNNALLAAAADPTAAAQFMLQYNALGSQGSANAAMYSALGNSLSSLFSRYGSSTGYNGGTGLNTAGAGGYGNYGSTYQGSFGNTPVYSPQIVA